MIEELAALKRMTAKNKSCVNFTNVVIFFYHISLQHYLTVYENKSNIQLWKVTKMHLFIYKNTLAELHNM